MHRDGPNNGRRALPVIGLMVALIAAALGIAACGGDDDGGSGGGGGGSSALSQPTDATLVLDFVPNAVHAGIYVSVADGCYKDNNINLDIIQPTSTADTLKLIDAGKADFGIADGIDVASQIADGRGAKGIMAVVQRPLGGPITLKDENITSPKQLEGKTVGVTGVPSDNAVLDTTVKDDGGDPSNIDVVTIGFNGVQNLESGKIDAFTGFAVADGAQLEVDGYPIRAFPLDEYGGPTYPGLVTFSTEDKIKQEPDLMQAFVDCTVDGYNKTIEDPNAALKDLESEVKGLDPELAKKQLDGYVPLFQAKASQYGEFNTDNLKSLSDFLIQNDLASKPISPDRYATNEFVNGSSN